MKKFNPFGVPVVKKMYRILDGIRQPAGERVMLIPQKTWDNIVSRPSVHGAGRNVEYTKISMEEFYRRKGIIVDVPKPKPAPPPVPVYSEADYKEDYATAKQLIADGQGAEAVEVINRALDYKNSPHLRKLLKQANESETDG